MKRQNIRDAFDRIRPDREMRERMLEGILSAASAIPPERKDISMKYLHKKSLLIAAMIGLMIFLMGCAVVAMRLQDMKIGEYTDTEHRYIDENGEKVYETEVNREVISLQGFAGSPSQMAAREWYEFDRSYDQDGKLLAQADEAPMDVPAEYDAYAVYTQEMMDKVDEIAGKYGLELAGPMTMMENGEMEIFFEALGLEDLHREGVSAEYATGYFYGCGNFKSEFYLDLKDDLWPHEILASMRYCGKDYLDTVFVHITDAESWEEWNYTLADGREVLSLLGKERAWIFCENEKGFLSVGISSVYENEDGTKHYMSRETVELAAEALDFTVVPRKPDMAETERRLEESRRAEQARKEALEGTVPSIVRDSYANELRYLQEQGFCPENCYYALADVTGDGEAEFLMGGKDSFGHIYTIQNGKVLSLLSFGMDTGCYLCRDNVVQHRDFVGEMKNYYFYKLDGGEVKYLDWVGYDMWEESWFRAPGGVDSGRVLLSEAEAMEIVDAYGIVDVELKPVTEYLSDGE